MALALVISSLSRRQVPDSVSQLRAQRGNARFTLLNRNLQTLALVAQLVDTRTHSRFSAIGILGPEAFEPRLSLLQLTLVGLHLGVNKREIGRASCRERV